MLGDAPHAFDVDLVDVEGWDDDRWRVRLSSALMPDSVLFVATNDEGHWVGQMAAREYLNHDPARVWLLEVFVRPDHRGTGLATKLLQSIEAWVVARGHDRLYLDVHEFAVAARRFYSGHGFSETGSWQPHPRNPAQRELEMVKLLERPSP